MQLSREDLLKAYKGMCEIREFDDAVHYEFAADAMPGFVHLYVGEEASAMGICLNVLYLYSIKLRTCYDSYCIFADRM